MMQYFHELGITKHNQVLCDMEIKEKRTRRRLFRENKELANEFKSQPCSKEYFLSSTKSVRKIILQWLVLAKRPETRQKRIKEIAKLAARKLKPKQFRYGQ